MSISEVVETYKYPEHDTYVGAVERAEFTFRTVKGLTLIIPWLMEELIVVKAKLADVTPLRAVLKAKTIQESYLDYVTTEYTLILYFHDSPAVASIILAIAAALTAAGFLVLSWNATPETWGAVAKVPEALAKIPESISKIPLYAAVAFMGYLAIKVYGMKDYVK